MSAGLCPGFKGELLRLSAVQLKSLALACGTPRSGTKPVLADLLLQRGARLGRLRSSPCRVVSLDLGLRNTGVARLVAPPLDAGGAERPLVEQLYRDALPSAGVFAYPEAAEMVIDLCKRSVDVSCDAVIVEKQMARSGSRILPSTVVKINVIEGMIHAVLRSAHAGLQLESIYPKDVLAFWDKYFLTTKGRAKQTKHAAYETAKHTRTSLVRTWLAEPNEAPVRFVSGVTDCARKGKLDDMDDALVQAVTWTHWRRNAAQVMSNLQAGIDPLHSISGP